MRWMLWMTIALCGCTVHPVKCDSHLQAINTPAPTPAAAAQRSTP